MLMGNWKKKQIVVNLCAVPHMLVRVKINACKFSYYSEHH